MSSARRVATARLGWAILLLTCPRLMLTVALPPQQRRSPTARRVVTVLGLRNLAQSLIELTRPGRIVLTGAALVDAVHALSFLGFAAVRPDPRLRRAVVLNVVTASLLGAATISTCRTPPRPVDSELKGRAS